MKRNQIKKNVIQQYQNLFYISNQTFYSPPQSFDIISGSRENWRSPVIQATWEARAVGWLEV
jgi:hypothetical protein